jgi:hypothetical protein
LATQAYLLKLLWEHEEHWHIKHGYHSWMLVAQVCNLRLRSGGSQFQARSGKKCFQDLTSVAKSWV